MATPKLLSQLKSLYPNAPSPLQNPWYTVAAVAFSASNLPEAVPTVFQSALGDLQAVSADHSDALLLVRKMKDALFKSGLLSGYPKVKLLSFQCMSNNPLNLFAQAINALVALNKVIPEELRDDKPQR